MARLYQKEEVVQQKSVIEIVRESLDVDAEGVVRFRSRVGRGSGKAVEIPGSEFDEFVTLMVQARESREALAEQERALQKAAAEAAEAKAAEAEASDTDEEEA